MERTSFAILFYVRDSRIRKDHRGFADRKRGKVILLHGQEGLCAELGQIPTTRKGKQ